jgi:hypothetical protein
MVQVIPAFDQAVHAGDIRWQNVVADSFALAAAALEKADIVWDESKGLKLSTKDVFELVVRALVERGAVGGPKVYGVARFGIDKRDLEMSARL